MRWTMRVVRVTDGNFEVVVTMNMDGSSREAAREAAILAEKHGDVVEVYRSVVDCDEATPWVVCKKLWNGQMFWSGSDNVVAVCEDRHGGWHDEFPLPKRRGASHTTEKLPPYHVRQ